MLRRPAWVVDYRVSADNAISVWQLASNANVAATRWQLAKLLPCVSCRCLKPKPNPTQNRSTTSCSTSWRLVWSVDHIVSVKSVNRIRSDKIGAASGNCFLSCRQVYLDLQKLYLYLCLYLYICVSLSISVSRSAAAAAELSCACHKFVELAVWLIPRASNLFSIANCCCICICICICVCKCICNCISIRICHCKCIWQWHCSCFSTQFMCFLCNQLRFQVFAHLCILTIHKT